MSANCKHILDILKRDGTGRPQREHAKLDPAQLKLHGFDLKDWMLFAYNFSRHIHFFSKSSAQVPQGNWSDFFQFFTNSQLALEGTSTETLDALKEELERLLQDAESESSLTPHLTLFVTFLKLLEKSTNRFNGLNKRHLDFYFQEVLNIQQQPLSPDKVYVIFELAKNASQVRVEEGTVLDAGKDDSGMNRNYSVKKETVLNKATVAELKSIYHDLQQPISQIKFNQGEEKAGHIVAAPIANSLDGVGGDFPEGKVQWWPFGHPSNCYGSTSLPAQPAALLGFTLASSLFRLQEGQRIIHLQFKFEHALPEVEAELIRKAISIELTDEKEWYLYNELFDETTQAGAEKGEGFLNISFSLSPDAPAIVAYDPAIHGGNYESVFPLLRIVFRTEQMEGYQLYRVLQENALIGATLQTRVEGVRSVVLENDHGRLNPEKPFFPFTPRPGKGASFRINYPEAMEKPWENITIGLDWLNTPDDFKVHYQAYGPLETFKISGRENVTIPNSPVDDHTYFTVNQSPGTNGEESVQQLLFTQGPAEVNDQVVYQSEFTFSKPSQFGKGELLSLSLNKTFLHEKYGHFYTLATIRNGEDLELQDIPNEPYTPLAEDLTLSYTATAAINFSDPTSHGDLQLFHEEPFGQVGTLPGQTDQNKFLVPNFEKGGTLLIGLENAKSLQHISLLFQMREGSENPAHQLSEEEAQINWEILSENEWVPLSPDQILLDQTRNFLKTGLFKFVLPKAANTKHQRMPSGYHWLKAKGKMPFDAVCQLIAVEAQAVEAVFQPGQDQKGDHLAKGLEEGTISKLKQRLGTIKSVYQPFPSFGGKTEEQDAAYYRRVSERLRHKKRAITLWDYEHLILEQFPQIYKVKCLNHTSVKSYQSPGNVTLIVVPDTVRQSVYDIYQPRVSKALLEQVSQFINHLNSFHVHAEVINPEYEEIKVSLGVKFRVGFDENFYSKKLQEDINKYLSPWAYDQQSTVEFGITLHRSLFIHYLEKLPYLDYLEDVKFLMRTMDQKNPCEPLFEEVADHAKVSPSGPKAILVSAKTHHIQLVKKHCTSHTVEN